MSKQHVVADPEGFDTLAGAPDISDEEFVKEFIPVPPDMDPGNPAWNPTKYFAAQEKVIIVMKKTTSDMLSDPDGTKIIKVPVGINGYTLEIIKGKPTRVPKDFARYLVDIGAAFLYADAADALER